jgi:hypothetical protein
MRTLQSTSALLLLMIGITGLCAQSIQQAPAGNAATGVVILENRLGLRLDVKPCARTQDKVILEFRPPYKKIAVGTVQCPSGRYSRTQVIQQPGR